MKLPGTKGLWLRVELLRGGGAVSKVFGSAVAAIGTGFVGNGQVS